MSAVNYKELNLNKIWLRPLQILLLSVALYTTIIIYHSNRNHLGQYPPPPSEHTFVKERFVLKNDSFFHCGILISLIYFRKMKDEIFRRCFFCNISRDEK